MDWVGSVGEDIHAGDPRKVEGFESHLRARFPDALRSYCPHCSSRFNSCTHELIHTSGDKLLELSLCDTLQLIQYCKHKLTHINITLA